MHHSRRRPQSWLIPFVVILLGFAAYADDETPAPAPAAVPVQNWTKPYKDLHELVVKLDFQVQHRFYPEFTIIKDGTTIANISVDLFASTVLGEADEVFTPYRQALQDCIDRGSNEYRSPKKYSYEQFAWALDNYVRLLVGAVSQQEDTPTVNGVRERKVTTDRTWYAFSRLLVAYLEEKAARNKGLDAETYASDRALVTTVSDIARRVFRLDLTTKFDRYEYLDKGPKSQSVFRDLAQNEGGNEMKSAAAPLAELMGEKEPAPTCRIALPPRRNGQVARQ